MERSDRPAAGPTAPVILLADDEEPIRIIARRTLEMAGYRVLLAADGQQAIRLYQEHQSHVGVVLTDMAMPGMDGPQLIDALARQNPAVRIVIMTGYHVSEADGGPPLPPQVVACLDKPFTADLLKRTVATALAAFPGAA